MIYVWSVFLLIFRMVYYEMKTHVGILKLFFQGHYDSIGSLIIFFFFWKGVSICTVHKLELEWDWKIGSNLSSDFCKCMQNEAYYWINARDFWFGIKHAKVSAMMQENQATNLLRKMKRFISIKIISANRFKYIFYSQLTNV